MSEPHRTFAVALLGTGRLATAIAAAAERSPLAVTLGSLPERRFAAQLERATYRVVADTLTVAERAGAQEARVEATAADGRLVVRVEHDGAGDGHPGELVDDRVQALAGRLGARRTATGASVVAEVPCG